MHLESRNILAVQVTRRIIYTGGETHGTSTLTLRNLLCLLSKTMDRLVLCQILANIRMEGSSQGI